MIVSRQLIPLGTTHYELLRSDSFVEVRPTYPVINFARLGQKENFLHCREWHCRSIGTQQVSFERKGTTLPWNDIELPTSKHIRAQSKAEVFGVFGKVLNTMITTK